MELLQVVGISFVILLATSLPLGLFFGLAMYLLADGDKMRQ